MGDTTGSSSAAQRAQETATTEDPKQGLSLLDRIFKRASNTAERAAAGDSNATRPVDAGERVMIGNLREMHALRVEDIAVPRADIHAIPSDAPLDDIVKMYRETTLTRLPVYGDTLDEPLGFLHLKDFALNHGFEAQDQPFDITPLMRRVLYVPPSMPVAALLRRMQASRIHMALVIDEYGGVDGLVTIEDVLEQVVGAIEDEHDEAEVAAWREEAPGVYLASARAELEEFEQATSTSFTQAGEDEEIETLGGLVFKLAGRVPERAEVICHPEGHEFEVIEADGRRIKRMRVRLAGAISMRQAAE
ncbi:MAG: hemolysin family protein [Pseudomonadota bacterium]